MTRQEGAAQDKTGKQQAKTQYTTEQGRTGQAGMSQDRTRTQQTIVPFKVVVSFEC